MTINPTGKGLPTPAGQSLGQLEHNQKRSHPRALKTWNGSLPHQAGNCDIDVPCPPGLSYKAFQREGIIFALARPDTLLADEPGLGKTIQALGVANAMLQQAGALRILVVAPKIALAHWVQEARKWLIGSPSVVVWTPRQQPDGNMVIVNYEVLTKPAVHSALHVDTWDLVVFDEAHKLKNHTAARTKACLGRLGGWSKNVPIPARRRLFLTGTPILNRPAEIFTILHACGVPEARSYYEFTKRYCDGHITPLGWVADGATNLPELQDLLRRSVMVRRLKSDVFGELAAKRYSLIRFEPATPAMLRAIKAENAAEAASRDRQADVRRRIATAETTGNQAAMRAAVAEMRSAAWVHLADMSRLRHDTARAKIPLVVEHVTYLLQNSVHSVLIMAHHKDVISGIAVGLEAAGFPVAVITGDTSQPARLEAQRDIQTRTKRVFVGSMQACGVAITLSAATIVVFAEQDWVPGVMTQAEDRAHRIGQRASVLVQHLLIDGSFDARMAKTILDKSLVIDAALGDRREFDCRTSHKIDSVMTTDASSPDMTIMIEGVAVQQKLSSAINPSLGEVGPESTAGLPDTVLEVVLRNGRVLRVPPGSDPLLVAQMAAAIEQAGPG